MSEEGNELVQVKCLDCKLYMYSKRKEVKNMKCPYCGFPKEKKGLKIIEKQEAKA